MTTYRRKPSYVSAVQLTQDAVISRVLDKTPLPEGCYLAVASAHPSTRNVYHAVIRLQTKDRELVMPGDWIVRDADGALRVVKPEVFAERYEAVESDTDHLRSVVRAAAYSVIHRGTLQAFDVSQLADAVADRVIEQIGCSCRPSIPAAPTPEPPRCVKCHADIVDGICACPGGCP